VAEGGAEAIVDNLTGKVAMDLTNLRFALSIKVTQVSFSEP